MLRIHADGSSDPSRAGIVDARARPAADGRTTSTARAGMRGRFSALVDATGARDLGLVERSDLTGFNWADVPVVLVETGFMTNPAEGRLPTLERLPAACRARARRRRRRVHFLEPRIFSTASRPSACTARRRSSGSGTASTASTVVSAPSNSSRSSTTARDSSAARAPAGDSATGRGFRRTAAPPPPSATRRSGTRGGGSRWRCHEIAPGRELAASGAVGGTAAMPKHRRRREAERERLAERRGRRERRGASIAQPNPRGRGVDHRLCRHCRPLPARRRAPPEAPRHGKAA